MIQDLVVQIWIAVLLDSLLGDPRWLPHPVQFIGRFAQRLEKPMRRMFSNPLLAGSVTALLVIGGTAATAAVILFAAGRLSSVLHNVLSIWMLYIAFAAKDLSVHSRQVGRALEQDGLPAARKAVARMVGRDTAELDEQGVVRAAVESVAENYVDGMLAPLFYAFLFGPVGALAYKAVNTLDSTFGYRNEQYLYFGRASARIDDAANFIPARLSLLFITAGAVLCRLRVTCAWSVGLRDARKHKSPNAGYPEAAFAGALGVQMGGPLMRKGIPSSTPLLGDPLMPFDRKHIRKANQLMYLATLTALLLLSGAVFGMRAVCS